MIILAAPYETTDPTVDLQIISMKAAGADVFVNTGIPKFAAQAIRKAAEIEWKPLHILSSVGNSVGATLKPAGLAERQGHRFRFLHQGPDRPAVEERPRLSAMGRLYGQILSGGRQERRRQRRRSVVLPDVGAGAQAMRRRPHPRERHEAGGEPQKLHACRCCCPASTINTSPTDFAPIKQIQMARFDGQRWQLFGSLINGQAPA